MLVTGLAAAKKKNRGASAGGAGSKKKSAGVASSVKGFGAKPPTFEEVVATFKTRMGPNALTEKCPCGTTKDALYQDCCAPFHSGNKVPQQPLEVLKTRYTAFYFRLVPYIIQTTHPVCRDYSENKIKWAKELDKNGMFDSCDFVALEPVEQISQGSDDKEAFLEFKVTLRAKGSGETTVISEKSRFLLEDQDNQGWLYAGGDVRSEVVGLEDTILNP